MLQGLFLLLCCWLSWGPLPGYGTVPLKLVDVPLVVCKGGPGNAVAKIWPADMPSDIFNKLGEGKCSIQGGGHDLEVEANATEAGRNACEAKCTANVSCGAYDFCTRLHCAPRCRLFPAIKEPREMSKERGFACYVKQLPNASKPHVISFLRTSQESSSVRFTLTDSSEERKTIVHHTDVQFESFNVRRLDEDDRTAQPTAFKRRGKGSGGHGGRGRSSAVGRGNARSGRPKGNAGRGVTRAHLPAARTRSGQRAAGHFSNARNPRLGFYGYSSRHLNKNFPLGYRSTATGISGMSVYTRHSPVLVTSWLGSAYLFSRFSTMCSCGPGRPCDRCGITHGADGSDDANWEIEDDMRREDITSTGFIPEDYTYPLLLTITHVSGYDYNESRICPPAGWDPRPAKHGSSSWTPPRHQDLFFAITQLEDLAAEDSKHTILVIVVVCIVSALAIGIPLAAYCINKYDEKHQEKKKKPKVLELPKSFRKNYNPLPIALGANS